MNVIIKIKKIVHVLNYHNANQNRKKLFFSVVIKICNLRKLLKCLDIQSSL